MDLGLDQSTSNQIEQGKDLISGYLDKGALKGAIERLGKGEAASAGAKAGGALDIGIGLLDAGKDIEASLKNGSISIAGDNDYLKAANVAGMVAGVAETAAIVDPLLAPAAFVVGTGAELTSDVLNWFGDREDSKKQSSPAMKQTQTISVPMPPKIPPLVNTGMVHLHNNNVLQKVIS